MRQAAPTAARSTEPHPESARFAPAGVVLPKCPQVPSPPLGRVGAPRLSLPGRQLPLTENLLEESIDEGGPLADDAHGDLYDAGNFKEELAMESEVTV